MRYISDRQRLRIADMKAKHKAGATVEQLCAEYHLKPTTVCGYIGVSSFPFIAPYMQRGRKQTARKTRMHKLPLADYKAGMSVEELAAKYGVTTRTMCGYLGISAYRYLGLPPFSAYK